MGIENNTYWVTVRGFNGDASDCEGYRLDIIKIEGMSQEINANAMFEKLNSSQSLMLYINFDSGKSTIKQESIAIVNELFKMLNDNPTLKIIIEGHTDNDGDRISNQKLSELRSQSVKSYLTQRGISEGRITTIGFGQDKPIADNTTEDGKSKNRRVEIKKI